MRWIIAAVLCVFAASVSANALSLSDPPAGAVSVDTASSADVLPARQIFFVPPLIDVAELSDWTLVDFDLLDAQTEHARSSKWANHIENPARSFWAIKHQWDLGWIGFNGGMINGTIIGTHLTVAEWGRWNFGTPGAGLGFVRHETYNRYTKQSVMSEDVTFMANISISYRLGFIQSLGYHAYLTFANSYDLRFNYPTSQIGFSFSRQ